MEHPFSKYSGCGNDFVLINNLAGQLRSQNSNLIQSLCHRQKGIGADGVVLLEKAQAGDFRMRIFNCDGSEAEMCGNGLRCLMKFIQDEGFNRPSCLIQTMHRQLQVSMKDDLVFMQMGAPTDIRWDLKVRAEGVEYAVEALDTGVPHAVLFVEKLEGLDVNRLGRQLRTHAAFAPKGTNVNFVERCGPRRLRIRTYERGVEQETLACGTGAAAAAIAAMRQQMQPPVCVEFYSGEMVEVDYKVSEGRIHDVVQTGPARKIFHGVIALP